MKILHVIETMSPNQGGPVTVIKGLVKAQIKSGIAASVITTNTDLLTHTYCKPGRYAVIEGGQNNLSIHSVQFYPLRFSFGLFREIMATAEEYDLIHIHGLYRFPQTFAAWWAKHSNIPYIIRPFGSLDPYLYKQSSRSILIKRLYEHWFDLPNLHVAGAIHYLAEEERERAGYLKLRSPSFVVPNGIDLDSFETLPSRGAFRKAHNFDVIPLVLFLGRVNFKKGLDLLVPALEIVRHVVPGTQLAIVGPEHDDYGRKVRIWAQKRGLTKAVHFIGPLESADVIQAYVDADIFVLPSYTEPFPLTVVEAMACGLPVVISDQVNIHREVAESGGGLVTRCDVDEIAQALITLLKDRDRRRVMGEVGRRFVQQYYTWPVIVDALTHEYENVIKRTQQKNAESAKCN